MRVTSVCSVLFVVIATSLFSAQSSVVKRDVVLELTLPNGATPQLRITEGEMGSVELPDVGKFGFVPTVNDHEVIVELLDLAKTPDQRLGRVVATVDGARREFEARPGFAVRIVRVVTP